MTPCNFPPDHSNLASTNSSLSFVDISNALSKVKLRILDAVASFDFYEGCVRFAVSFATGVRNVFASYIESRMLVDELRVEINKYR